MTEIQVEAIEAGLQKVTVSGAADRDTGTALREAIDRALAQPGDKVLVDLTSASFIDSAVLGTLAAASAPGTSPTTSLAIVCPPGDVRVMFEITALDTLLELYDTQEEARDALGSSEPRCSS